VVIIGCDEHAFLEVCSKKGKWRMDGYVNIGRCYVSYSLLADVRNYYGLKPMDQPRGLPDDVTERLRKDFDSWGSDAHSATYLYLDELLDFNYSKVKSKTTYKLNMIQYKRYINGASLAVVGEEANRNYRMINYLEEAPNVVSEGDMKDLLECPKNNLLKEIKPNTYITQVTSIEILKEDEFNSITDAVELIKKEHPKTDPKNMRIVMWFDN